MANNLFTLCVQILGLVCYIVHAKDYEGCKDPGSIDHGKHNLLSDDLDQSDTQIWLPGTRITYTCDEGFELKGEAFHVCTKSGWQPGIKPTCERISCDEIEIEHGIITTHTMVQYLPGNTINILCDDGYELQLGGKPYPISYIVCDKQGKWDAYDGTGILPVCQALLCDDPLIINHASHHVVDPHGNSENKNMEGARAYYSCDQGYKLLDESADILKCEGSVWVGEKPVCLLKPGDENGCLEPSPFENGYYSVYGGPLEHSMIEGTKIYYMCQKGYNLIGESVRTCIKGGWTGSTPRCDKSLSPNGCPLPKNINHGVYAFIGKNYAADSGLIPEGSEVYYSCHTGYRFRDEDGSPNMVCRRGQWQGILPACLVRTNCDPPQEIQNGHWMILGYHEKNNKYIIGSKILYECESGYQAYGATMSECQGEGYWSKYPPKCLPKDQYCEDPGEVHNGYYVCEPSPMHCDQFKVGVRIRYVCNSGHEPSGTAEQLCLNGGKWSALKVVCKSETTPAPSLSMMRVNSNTLTIVIATSCSVLGLLLIVMVVMALQRRKPHPRLCHPAPPPAAPYQDPRAVPLDEHDRMALIAFADGVQVVLPSYEEAIRGSSHRLNMPRFPEPPGRRQGDYRPLPTIPSVLRSSRHDSSPHPARLDNHRSSIVTTTSSTTRDNMSLAFGSIDTMNVSDGTSTTVTIETYDSAASNPSIAASQRATAGSLGSANSNGSLATEDAPLLDQNSQNDSGHILNSSICESTSPEGAKQET